MLGNINNQLDNINAEVEKNGIDHEENTNTDICVIFSEDGILTHKKCTVCKKMLLTSEFHKQTKSKYGLFSLCKTCRKQYRARNNQWCVYRVLNVDNEIIYVGKTCNLPKRVYEHLNGHKTNIQNASEIHKIQYKPLSKHIDKETFKKIDKRAHDIEYIFINYYKPKYNGKGRTTYEGCNVSSDLNWIDYNFTKNNTKSLDN